MRVVLLASGWLLTLPVIALGQEPPSAGKVTADRLAQVETQLKRLAEQAERERPQLDSPSRALAYQLLADLATKGEPIKELTEADRRGLGVGKTFEGKVIALAEDRRVVLGSGWMCFRDGGAGYLFAEYYARRDGKWQKLGSGIVFPRINGM